MLPHSRTRLPCHLDQHTTLHQYVEGTKRCHFPQSKRPHDVLRVYRGLAYQCRKELTQAHDTNTYAFKCW